MASESVANQSVVLSVDASNLNAGMKKAAQDAKAQSAEIAKNMKVKTPEVAAPIIAPSKTAAKGEKAKASEGLKTFKDSAKEKIGETFGGGSLLAGGAKAGAIGLAVAGVALLGKELYDAAFNAKKLEREFRASMWAMELSAERVTESIARTKEALTEFDDVAASAEGVKAYGQQLKRAETDLKIAQADLDRSVKDEAQWDSKWNSIEAMNKYLRSELESTGKNAAQATEVLKKTLDERRKMAEELRRKNGELANPMSSVAARTELRRFVKEQEDALKDLNRTADESKLDKLKEKFGFKDADLGAARLAIAAKNAGTAAEYIKQLGKEVNNLQNGIEESADDAKLEEFVKLGIDKAQIARIKELIALKKQQSETYKGLKPLEAGTWDAIKFQNEYKFNLDKSKTQKQEKLLTDVVAKLVQINFSILGLNVDSPTI